MTVNMFYRSDFRIRFKADATEFYNGVKSCTIIPYNDVYSIRVEPNRCFSIVSKQAIYEGKAWMIPSVYDDDGKLAYNYRKYINAYLSR